MSISSTVKKIMPYIKTTSGYVLHRLSSQAVEMDDGTTLEEKVTALNNLISQKVDTSTVVNNLLTTEAGFVLDARQGKTLNDSISELSSKITINASAESSKKTITTSAWGAVIHSIILQEAGTYLVGADYAGTNVCFVSSGGGNKYLMPGGTALITVDARTVIDFKSNTSNRATWTEFLPFYVRLM